jgi:hypothetical protein
MPFSYLILRYVTSVKDIVILNNLRKTKESILINEVDMLKTPWLMPVYINFENKFRTIVTFVFFATQKLQLHEAESSLVPITNQTNSIHILIYYFF